MQGDTLTIEKLQSKLNAVIVFSLLKRSFLLSASCSIFNKQAQGVKMPVN